MTIIQRTGIPYLNEKVLEKYENVIVVSGEGLITKMNLLILCAMSDSLKMAFDENESDHTIITEFSQEEVQQVKKYYTQWAKSCNYFTVGQKILKIVQATKTREIK